jgi:Fe2+ or Zn2+ uptake regulation protein
MGRILETCRPKTISFSILQNIFAKLKVRDYVVLAAVYNAEEYPQSYTYPSMLARDIGISKATAMRLLKRLETLGLLKRIETGYVTEYRPLSQDYGEYVRQKLSMKRAEKRFRQIFIICTRCGALNKARATQTRKKCVKCGWIFWITKNRIRSPEIEARVKSQIARARIAEEQFTEMEAPQTS